MAPDQSEIVQVPEVKRVSEPEPGPVPDPWLQNFRPSPCVTILDVREITIFKVPDLVRESTPEYFKIKNLQLGLQNRTLESSAMQILKFEIASVLHRKLSTSSSGIQSWEAFAGAVVDDVPKVRGKFETCTASMSDEAVRHHLALDALFLVFFFQCVKGDSFSLPEFKDIPSRHQTTIELVGANDLMLLENQIPMDLLKNAVRELCKLDDHLDEKRKVYESRSDSPENSFIKVVEDELDDILTTAIMYLHRRISNASKDSSPEHKEAVGSYIRSQYPRHTSSALETCNHLLDCLYHFLCGHALPFQMKKPTYVYLDSIPSVSSLEDAGIKVDVATDRLAWIAGSVRVHNSWIRSARLSLPKCRINHNSLMRFRNLAVYELLLQRNNEELHFGEMRTFLDFMVQLCREPSDFYLLRKRGVLNVVFGNNKVLELWDHCMTGLPRSNPSPQWVESYTAIHKHCRSSWKKWRRRNWGIFWNQPWIVISVSAAFVLLLLTGLQTWFTVVNSSSSKPFWPPSH